MACRPVLPINAQINIGPTVRAQVMRLRTRRTKNACAGTAVGLLLAAQAAWAESKGCTSDASHVMTGFAVLPFRPTFLLGVLGQSFGQLDGFPLPAPRGRGGHATRFRID